jgi:hypothetical protein
MRVRAGFGSQGLNPGEVVMSNTRREFLTVLGAAAPVFLMRAQNPASQGRPSSRPSAPDSTPESDDSSAPGAKSPTKSLLEANEKDIKKNIEKLFQLATDLKAEVEKTDSSQVLSLAMVKKAEEIEKLARDIKTRAKG